jgi:hypothetical protein
MHRAADLSSLKFKIHVATSCFTSSSTYTIMFQFSPSKYGHTIYAAIQILLAPFIHEFFCCCFAMRQIGTSFQVIILNFDYCC